MRTAACFIALFCTLAAACTAAAPVRPGTAPAARPPTAAVVVVDATVRAAVAGQPEAWAYVTLDNPGAADAVVSATSEAAGQVVLRAVRVADAGRLARSVASIPLPANGRLVMGADGWLLAFVHVRRELRAGDTVQGSLELASGRSVAVAFRVVESAGDPADGGN